MAQYAADISIQPTEIIDGIVRRVWRVEILRYDHPTAKPVKAGSTEVRAFLVLGGLRLARKAARDLMARDQAKRSREINAKIDRIEQVNLYRK